jgi:iron complex outermembrane receptor protein
LICLAFFAASVGLVPGFAQAQTVSDSATVEDVVVTAPEAPAPTLSDQQVQVLQSKPVAATVVTEQQIQADQITNLEQAKKLEPSLQFKALNIQNLTYNIRGFGNATYSQITGVFGGVPIYLDGVYLPRPGASVTDIPGFNGVTVLAGPQSTSGGWDSTGGAVFMTTALPTFTQQESAEFSYGTYNYAQVKGSVSGPIEETGDKAAFSLAFINSNRDGYITDVIDPNFKYNSWHDTSVHGQILYQPEEDLSVRIISDFARATQACCINLFNGAVTNYLNGAPVTNNFYTRAARFDYGPAANQFSTYTTDINGYVSEAVMNWGTSAEIKYNFSGYTFSSLTAFNGYDYYPDWRTSQVINIETNFHNNGAPTAKSVQQQFAVATPTGEKVEANTGVFYYYEAFRTWGNSMYGQQAGSWYGNTAYLGTVDNLALNGLARNSYTNNFTNSIAPFGQAVWHATPELDFTVGLRYSYTDRAGFSEGLVTGLPVTGLTAKQLAAVTTMRQALGGPNYTLSNPYWQANAETHQGLVSGLASAAYKLNPDLLGYVLFSEGGRPGGPNLTTSALPPGATLTVKAETLQNYEIGLKGSFFDQKVTANAAAFVMVDQNYITNLSAVSSIGTTTSYLANAPGALSRGVQVNIRAKPIDGLNLFASGIYDDAFFTNFKNGPCPYEQANLQNAANPTCDMTGHALSLVPRWAFAVGGEYRQRLPWIPAIELPFLKKPISDFVGVVGADFTYQTSFYSGADDSIYSKINGYGLLNLHAGITTSDDSWYLTAWIHNALDQHYFTTLSAATTPGAGIIGGSVGQPLMAGLTIGAKF